MTEEEDKAEIDFDEAQQLAAKNILDGMSKRDLVKFRKALKKGKKKKGYGTKSST